MEEKVGQIKEGEGMSDKVGNIVESEMCANEMQCKITKTSVTAQLEDSTSSYLS
jgi:hypothetical protein